MIIREWGYIILENNELNEFACGNVRTRQVAPWKQRYAITKAAPKVAPLKVASTTSFFLLVDGGDTCSAWWLDKHSWLDSTKTSQQTQFQPVFFAIFHDSTTKRLTYWLNREEDFPTFKPPWSVVKRSFGGQESYQPARANFLGAEFFLWEISSLIPLSILTLLFM